MPYINSAIRDLAAKGYIKIRTDHRCNPTLDIISSSKVVEDTADAFTKTTSFYSTSISSNSPRENIKSKTPIGKINDLVTIMSEDIDVEDQQMLLDMSSGSHDMSPL